jgi:hypothetical protein
MECHQEVSNQLGRDFVAFMALDAHDPAQQTLAATAFNLNARNFVAQDRTKEATRPAAGPAPPAKTPLDDDPAVQALARMLQNQ